MKSPIETTVTVLLLLSPCKPQENVIYTSPWRTNRNNLKIIHFKEDGGFKQTNVPPQNLVFLNRMVDKVKQKFEVTDFLKAAMMPQTNFLSNIKKIFTRMDETTEKQEHKMKILTYCMKKTNVCRFLSCPKHQENCYLCELNTKTENTVPRCEVIHTRYRK